MAYGSPSIIDDFLPKDAPATERQRLVAEMLTRKLREHRKNPELTPASAIPRSSISQDSLSAKDLSDAGFVKSVVAVPETGQSSIVTWRHPSNGMHLHKHPEKWLFHEDRYPSLSMLMRKYKESNPNATVSDKAAYMLGSAIPESYSHIVHEGLPGWVNWASGTIRGNKGFGHENERPSVARTIGGIATVAAALSATQGMLTDRMNILGNTATVGGFVGGQMLASKLYNTVKGDNPVLRRPGWGATMLLAGLPIASALFARRAANWATTPDRRYEV